MVHPQCGFSTCRITLPLFTKLRALSKAHAFAVVPNYSETIFLGKSLLELPIEVWRCLALSSFGCEGGSLGVCYLRIAFLTQGCSEAAPITPKRTPHDRGIASYWQQWSKFRKEDRVILTPAELQCALPPGFYPRAGATPHAT